MLQGSDDCLMTASCRPRAVTWTGLRAQGLR